MHPNLFSIGPFTLHTYGLMVAIAIFCAVALLRSHLGRRGFSADRTDSLAVLLIFSGVVGARVVYFAVDGFAGLRGDPLSFFRIWEGGLVFYGGVIGAVIALAIYARQWQTNFLSLSDALIPALLLAHSIGRLGCFFAGCCYGRPTECALGVTFSDPNSLAPLSVALHPTQLYESAAVFVLFLASLSLLKRSPRTGVMTASYLMAYGAVRFALEFFRGDDRGHFVGSLSPSQLIAVVLFAIGSGLLAGSLTRRSTSRPHADPHITPRS